MEKKWKQFSMTELNSEDDSASWLEISLPKKSEYVEGGDNKDDRQTED